MWGNFRYIFYFIHMPKKNKIPCPPSKHGIKLPNTKLISDKCGTLDTLKTIPTEIKTIQDYICYSKCIVHLAFSHLRAPEQSEIV